jgi:hypothetical protein
LRGIRHYIASGLVLALALVALVGCGGDAGKASSDMQQGDAAILKLKPVSERLTKATGTLFASVFAGGKVDAASFQKNAISVNKAVDELTTGIEAARKDYAAIASLKNVAGYKKYADGQIKILDLNSQGLAQLKAFMTRWTPVISSPSFDPVAFVGASKQLSDQSSAIATQISALEKQAAATKKSEKL